MVNSANLQKLQEFTKRFVCLKIIITKREEFCPSSQYDTALITVGKHNFFFIFVLFCFFLPSLLFFRTEGHLADVP